jgi:hypothetical protein
MFTRERKPSIYTCISDPFSAGITESRPCRRPLATMRLAGRPNLTVPTLRWPMVWNPELCWAYSSYSRISSENCVGISRCTEMKMVNWIKDTSCGTNVLYKQEALWTRQGYRRKTVLQDSALETQIAVISGRVASSLSSPDAQYSDKLLPTKILSVDVG